MLKGTLNKVVVKNQSVFSFLEIIPFFFSSHFGQFLNVFRIDCQRIFSHIVF